MSWRDPALKVDLMLFLTIGKARAVVPAVRDLVGCSHGLSDCLCAFGCTYTLYTMIHLVVYQPKAGELHFVSFLQHLHPLSDVAKPLLPTR